MRKLILACCIVLSTCATAQDLHKLFKVADGSGKNLVAATTVDNELLLAYYLQSGGSSCLSVLRVSTAGDLLWSKAFLSAGTVHIPVSVAATGDSGAIISLMDTFQMKNIQLVKIGKTGNIQWSNSTYANYIGAYPIPVCHHSDGCIFLAHASEDSLFLKKLSTNGTSIWEKSYVGSSSLIPMSIAYDNSGFYIGGYDNNGSYTAFLIKTDTLGNVIWQKDNLGLSVGLNLLPVESGGVLISTRPYTGLSHGPDIKLAFVDAAGTVRWAKEMSLNNASPFRAGPNKIGLCAVNNSVVKVVIIDTLGDIMSIQSYHDSLAGAILSPGSSDKGFWISSINDNKLWIMWDDSSDNSGCLMQPDTVSIQPYALTTGELHHSTNVSSSVYSPVSFSSQPVSYTDTVLCGPLAVRNIAPVAISIYPNPVTSELIVETTGNVEDITIVISDVSGKKVLQIPLSKTTNINTSEWSKGLYIIQLRNATGNVLLNKIVKQ